MFERTLFIFCKRYVAALTLTIYFLLSANSASSQNGTPGTPGYSDGKNPAPMDGSGSLGETLNLSAFVLNN